MNNSITLPWPHKSLSPNKREHWSKKASAAKNARYFAYWTTKEAILGPICPNPTLKITFHPPDRRRRDRDNMLASLKSALDGVSDAIGIDDSEFDLIIIKGNPVKDGCVTIEFEQEKTE